MLRTYFLLSGISSGRAGILYKALGIEPGSVMCKVSAHLECYPFATTTVPLGRGPREEEFSQGAPSPILSLWFAYLVERGTEAWDSPNFLPSMQRQMVHSRGGALP